MQKMRSLVGSLSLTLALFISSPLFGQIYVVSPGTYPEECIRLLAQTHSENPSYQKYSGPITPDLLEVMSLNFFHQGKMVLFVGPTSSGKSYLVELMKAHPFLKGNKSIFTIYPSGQEVLLYRTSEEAHSEPRNLATASREEQRALMQSDLLIVEDLNPRYLITDPVSLSSQRLPISETEAFNLGIIMTYRQRNHLPNLILSSHLTPDPGSLSGLFTNPDYADSYRKMLYENGLVFDLTSQLFTHRKP